MEKITREEIKKLTEIPGKIRGQVFFTDFEYVKQIKGEKEANRLKEKMEEWGNPINYEKIKIAEWYPVGLRAVSLLIIKETFSWDDKEIEELGKSAPKLSFIVKTLMNFFLSIKRSFQESPNYWRKHYLIGELIPAEINEEKKYFYLHLKNFKVHPIICIYLTGFFCTIASFVLKTTKVKCKETKCVFKGDGYHEFLIRWE